jgi:hypothetical protein
MISIAIAIVHARARSELAHMRMRALALRMQLPRVACMQRARAVDAAVYTLPVDRNRDARARRARLCVRVYAL